MVLPAQANWAGPETGTASWYGEQHRGRLMSNGRPFNPDKLTAASWFYPLGTRVRVTLAEGGQPRRSVVVTITDRGPAWELVRKGRIIDLSQAAFQHLADGSAGLVPVTAEALKGVERRHDLVAACGSTSTAVAIKPAMGKENAQPKLRLVRDY